jgi:hypothetical protein
MEKKLHPIPGKKDPAGKMLANSLSKKNCFNCGGNDHWVVNCPDLLAVQSNELAGMARWIIFLGVLPYLAQVSVEKN